MGRSLLSLVLLIAAATCASAFVMPPASALAVRPATAPASLAVSMTSANKKAKAAKRKVREKSRSSQTLTPWRPAAKAMALMAALTGTGAKRRLRAARSPGVRAASA